MLRIEAGPWRIMLDHARACYPEECCGILLGPAGEPRVATAAIACANAQPDERRRRFSIDPTDLFAAIHRARAEGLTVIGFFHSHPDEEPHFSQTDHANTWPWVSNVVLSVHDGELRSVASYRLDPERGQATHENLVLPDQAASWW